MMYSMKNNKYDAPQLLIVEIDNEGLIASSNRIPLNPTPSTPATNKHEGPWNSKQWETTEE